MPTDGKDPPSTAEETDSFQQDDSSGFPATARGGGWEGKALREEAEFNPDECRTEYSTRCPGNVIHAHQAECGYKNDSESINGHSIDEQAASMLISSGVSLSVDGDQWLKW